MNPLKETPLFIEAVRALCDLMNDKEGCVYSDCMCDDLTSEIAPPKVIEDTIIKFYNT